MEHDRTSTSETPHRVMTDMKPHKILLDHRECSAPELKAVIASKAYPHQLLRSVKLLSHDSELSLPLVELVRVIEDPSRRCMEYLFRIMVEPLSTKHYYLNLLAVNLHQPARLIDYDCPNASRWHWLESNKTEDSHVSLQFHSFNGPTRGFNASWQHFFSDLETNCIFTRYPLQKNRSSIHTTSVTHAPYASDVATQLHKAGLPLWAGITPLLQQNQNESESCTAALRRKSSICCMEVGIRQES